METSLVTCSYCTVCDLLGLAGNIFNFLLGLAFAAAVLFVVVSGFLRIFAAGNKYRIELAKSGLLYSIVGFCVIFVSWVFIHSFYQVIGYRNSNWWQINCDSASEPAGNGTEAGKKYSSLQELVASDNVANLVGQDLGIEAIDLNSIDLANLKQDLNLLKPGEKIRFLTSYDELSDEDLNNYIIGSAGYPAVNDEQFRQLSKKFQEAASFNMLDGGAVVFGEGDYADLTTDPIDQDFNTSLDKLTERLKEKGAAKILVMKSGNSLDNWANCDDSNGDWVDFKNKCVSRKQVCGSESLNCTNVSNPYADCQCQPGSCLVNGKCEKNNIISTKGLNPQGDNDEDGDKIRNSVDQCLGTPKGQLVNLDKNSQYYGCSCSQINLVEHNCPSTRCEGPNLVAYPASAKDNCVNGNVTAFTCSPTSTKYNETCDQSQIFSDFNDKASQIQQTDPNLYNRLKDWLNQGSKNQGGGSSGSGSGSGGSTGGGGNTGGSGNTGDTGSTSGNTGSTSTGQTGTNNTGNTQTGNDTGSTYNPPSDLGKDGDFKRLAECVGFKNGEIPKNGAMVGFYTDKSHTRMNVWYLDPRTGKAVGSNGDTSGQQPLVTYPQGIGNQYGLGGNGIYAIQVQPHYSDSGDTRESPLTARSDVKMTSSGTNPKNNWRINLHPGTSTAGCLGLGGRGQSDGFMRDMWTTVRGSEKPADYNDDLSQAKGSGYDKHRARDTVLFSTMDAGTCQQPGAVDNAIKTLQSYKGYGGYDPQMIKFSS